jgi:pimeloyl-ACP methyl ester carboxylesterase
MSRVTMLRHDKVSLALHHVREGEGRALLLLHGLGERSPRSAPLWCHAWPGPIAALDFTGHGDSTVPRGGGYSAEVLLGDADAALAALGSVTVVGRGLGAYIALLLAGARATAVRGAILADGPGFTGGPVRPTSSTIISLTERPVAPDAYALVEMTRDLRPPDYAVLYVRLAVERSGLDEPLTIAAMATPPWLTAVGEEVGVARASIRDALATYQLLD